MAARKLFGSFRKGEANDPETYVAAVLAVLMGYPDAVVSEVCHPARGLPSRCDFLPTIREVREACETEAARIDRLSQLAARTPVRRLPAPPPGPGSRANVFIPHDTPQYPAMKKRAEAKGVDPCAWRYDEVRPGIWVELGWLDRPAPIKPAFVPMTDEQLRAKYMPDAAVELDPLVESEA